MSQLDCGFGEACQSVKRVLCVWSEQAYGRVKYPNYSEAHPCKCHLTYTQLLFYLTALKLYSTQPYIETRLNKRLEAIHVHRHVHKHTHNLSKHTYSLENNYRVWRGGKYTHTHTHTRTHCHACRKNNTCLWGWHQCCNIVYSNTVSPPWFLFTRQQCAWGLWEVLGDPAHSGDLSLKLNRQQQKSPRLGLLNYITVVH